MTYAGYCWQALRKKIRLYLVENEVTQDEFAEKTGIHRVTLNRIMNGKQTASDSTMLKIFTVLKG